MNAIIESNGILTTNNLFYQIGEYLNKEGLLVNIKGKLYPNRTGFRKVAMFLGINLEVVKENRVDTKNYFVYDFTVRASSKDGRYTECSASCASNEKEFNHLENDVRTTAQTRASNRAIADLLGITDITNYIGNKSLANDTYILSSQDIKSTVIKQNNSDSNSIKNEDIDRNITSKQKGLLIKLITEVFDDEGEQKGYIETLDELTKQEANFHIKQLLEEKRNQS